MKNTKPLLFISILFSLYNSFGQKNESNYQGEFYKLGFNYGFGSVDNPIFTDDDYLYDFQLRKIEIYYKIKEGIFYDLEFIFQPEYNTVKHQLTSDRYIVGVNHPLIDRVEEMKTLKKFHEYIMNFGMIARKKIGHSSSLYFLASIGPGYFEKTSERMEKGIGFSDNLAIGFSYDINRFFLDSRIGYRHVSNANINQVNDGYDSLIIDIGIGFYLL
ncbi:acyloxyacyl hydrolase [Zunongwangia sp. HRR-M8]|uniref:acyloxyacyl hydrolase n=1 Tax=Zunongwangia sp. HRR-M8 TaxID=3015170 RepID=UPI0022DE1026|nr:acyloxyacyl hydrolase [Zunongwangia sp. HRR-M8]WBL20830.1 acyloxyacyl hydrolase [Zunongwangia sp. HRR-M8]